MPLVKRRVLNLSVMVRGLETLATYLHEWECIAISLNCENFREASRAVLVVAGLGYCSNRSEMLHQSPCMNLSDTCACWYKQTPNRARLDPRWLPQQALRQSSVCHLCREQRIDLYQRRSLRLHNS